MTSDPTVKSPSFDLDTEQKVIASFVELARPIMLEFFSPNSCIACSRIAIEVFRLFGIRLRPHPVSFLLHIPKLNLAYTSGWRKDQITGVEPDRHRASPFRTGWEGHVIVQSRRFLIDPSFDQAFYAFAGSDADNSSAVTPRPLIAAFPMAETFRRNDFSIEFKVLIEGITGEQVPAEIRYDSNRDMSFLATPAWETDHLRPVIDKIYAAMKEALA